MQPYFRYLVNRKANQLAFRQEQAGIQIVLSVKIKIEAAEHSPLEFLPPTNPTTKCPAEVVAMKQNSEKVPPPSLLLCSFRKRKSFFTR